MSFLSHLGRIPVTIVAGLLVFVGPAVAQTTLLTPQVGTSIDELAEIRSGEVQPGWPESQLNPIDTAPPDAESLTYRLNVGPYPFDVLVLAFQGSIVAFQLLLDAPGFSEREQREMQPPDCLVAFNGAYRMMVYALAEADQLPARMLGASIGLATITMPDGSQALVRGDIGDAGCDVSAVYNSKKMQEILY